FEGALALVEKVTGRLATPDDRRAFLRRWLGLYSDAVLSNIRTGHDERARTLAESFATHTGDAELAAQLKAFEESLPTRGGNLTKEQQDQNKQLAKHISYLRKRLK
ncbi:MAG TPA: hypothetical protein VFU32_15025, partial [Ktedonobacterales bacterium]|nr:hypothetical protein [Ktedonobacterales bacterium]